MPIIPVSNTQKMILSPPSTTRDLAGIELTADFTVVGGGLAGVCAAIGAARSGLKVVLIQDRPVLGGNASSEVRLWVLGATAHMANNNRWAREGGLVGEILVENMRRNPEGNAILFDTVLLDKVLAEPNITLLLNTAVFEATKSDPDHIESVRAFCPQNSTMYSVRSPLFCDASGDGILGFLTGAAFRMGAESREEFGEKFAPSSEYGGLLGHSIYFYSKDTGCPVTFVPPTFALADITKIPRFRAFNACEDGCRLWWIEYGGRLDTVHESEKIKWELWKVVYGVWNHIKNSGGFPEAENLTLEWVGAIAGKRESRRFEGDYLLKQQDIVEQRTQPDAVAYGGWSIDLHPADGVYSPASGCDQWHSKGLYQIPYRCLYSRNIENLFLAGRTISATHVAFGSSRVMATCGAMGEVVGRAASLCLRRQISPRDIGQGARIKELQLTLIREGNFIPDLISKDPDDLAQNARITASSTFKLAAFPPDGPLLKLEDDRAMLLPVVQGPAPKLTLLLDVTAPTSLTVQLRFSSKVENQTPDEIVAAFAIPLKAGAGQSVELAFDISIDRPRYAFYCLLANPAVSIRTSEQRVTGILSVKHSARVEKWTTQAPTRDIGVDAFEFWTPERRPEGRNFALTVDPPLDVFRAENLLNGTARPVSQPNAWVADPSDKNPRIILSWTSPQKIARIDLDFDCDYDHPMESVLMGHPERTMPFCVKDYRVFDGTGQLIAGRTGNYAGPNRIVLETAVVTDRIVIEPASTWGDLPSSLFAVRCYGPAATA